MWDPEHFPGADNVPWPLLIRARYQYEVDAVVASVIVRNIGALGSVALAGELASVATKAVAMSREAGGRKKPGRSGAFLTALSDLDDWCGTRWPKWPGPKPGPRFDDVDPLVIVLADRALSVLEASGSPQLQEGLSGLLGAIADGQQF